MSDPTQISNSVCEWLPQGYSEVSKDSIFFSFNDSTLDQCQGKGFFAPLCYFNCTSPSTKKVKSGAIS